MTLTRRRRRLPPSSHPFLPPQHPSPLQSPRIPTRKALRLPFCQLSATGSPLTSGRKGSRQPGNGPPARVHLTENQRPENNNGEADASSTKSTEVRALEGGAPGDGGTGHSIPRWGRYHPQPDRRPRYVSSESEVGAVGSLGDEAHGKNSKKIKMRNRKNGSSEQRRAKLGPLQKNRPGVIERGIENKTILNHYGPTRRDGSPPQIGRVDGVALRRQERQHARDPPQSMCQHRAPSGCRVR